MPDGYTNLLPRDRRHLMRREYFLRLGSVAAIAAVGLVLVYAALLVPTYLYLVHSASAKQARLDSLTASLASSDEQTLSDRLTALSEDAATLTTLGKVPSLTGLLGDVLAVPHAGIALSGLTYTPIAGKAPATLALSGTAATRDALRQYQLALESAPFAASADLPVSAYAKDSDIPFAITITLASP